MTHPYIPSTAPEEKAAMLREIGVDSVEELFQPIPDALRLHRPLQVPPAIPSEAMLERHVARILAQNENCVDNLNFMGAGCYQHYVPAVVDEIVNRPEFLSGYAGEPYEDHGRFQMLFEYQSLMAELLDMDVVNVPAIDGAQAAATAVRMAARITGRRVALVSEAILPDKLLVMRNYCAPDVDLVVVPVAASGLTDLAAIQARMDDSVACVYYDTPSYLGLVEEQGDLLAEACHAAGALLVVGVDPITLGALETPAAFGADILCGDIQTLGVHMQGGGGHGGFIATRDEPRFVLEYPSRLFGITNTVYPGEYGFGDVAYDRTSFADREHAKEYVGTQAALWGIAAGVFLALHGPEGMKELGEAMIERARYAATRMAGLPGVSVRYADRLFAKEFVVDFSGTGKSVADLNASLRKSGIFGGVDLTGWKAEFAGCALYCMTEIHTKEDIDALVAALAAAIAE